MLETVVTRQRPVKLHEHLIHFHCERNHQGLGNQLIEPNAANTNAGDGRVQRRERVGGLLKHYDRKAH